MTAPTQKERDEMPSREFGDPENEKYPLDTPEHVRAAASYVEKEHNAGRLSDAKHKEILARVHAAEKRHGIGAGASKDSAWETVHRFDLRSGEIDSHRETAIGGVAARANLTRTGVFTYRNADGSERKELRHPDEVFDPESLDSLAHAVLTDDHPGSKVTTDSWKRDTIGHVAGRPKRSGQFVAGEIQVQHGPAAQKVTDGKLQEISCGYDCQLEPTPGDWNGEHYDGIQRRIRYNHVALGPRGWGRAGSDVRLHLDSAALVSGSDAYVPDMSQTLEQAQAALTKANADLETSRADTKTAKTDAERANATAAESKASVARLEAENALLKLQMSQRDDAANGAQASQKREAEIQEAIGLRLDAAKIFDEGWKADGKTNDAIRREAIAKMAPSLNLDAILAPLGDNKAAVSAVLQSTYLGAKALWEERRAANDLLGDVVHSDKADDEPGEGDEAENARSEMIKKRKDRYAKDKAKRDEKGRK